MKRKRLVVIDKEKSLLPPLDPDFLIDECDQAKLTAYARGLLAHLQVIRSGQKANRYPITKIRAATVWLLEAYIAAQAAPAPEAAQLIRQLLSVDPNASTQPARLPNAKAYVAAIKFEVAHPTKPTSKARSTASRSALAAMRDELAAYACRLLGHLRNIRSGQKANGYPITKIRAGTVGLLEACIAAQAAPVPEVAQLIRELLKVDPKASTLPVRLSNAKAYFAAIKFEAAHPPDPTGKAPSTASKYAVAVRMLKKSGKKFMSQKTAEGQIRGWRRLEHYQANVVLQRPASLRAKS